MTAGWGQAWPGVVSAALGILGTMLIFIWGPPQPTFIEGRMLVADLRDNEARALKRRRRRHIVMSRIGLGLIFCSFLLHLAVAWPRI